MNTFSYGYTALVYSDELACFGALPDKSGLDMRPRGWSEAYGYLGSYYRSYKAARREINWLLKNYPEKYKHWAIERIVINENDCRIETSRTCTLAQSKDAPQ